jgi:O-antigen/teichoic acid export membrane protein
MSDVLDTLKTKAVRGVFTLTFRRLVLKIIDTVGIITLARLLSQESFGVFGIVSFVVFTFLSFFSDVGFGAALIQKEEVSDDDLKRPLPFNRDSSLLSWLWPGLWLRG